MNLKTDFAAPIGADNETEFATVIQEESFDLQFAEHLLKANRAFPREFGDYVLESELGRGSTGIVYLAKHRDCDQVVAIKVISAKDCQVSQRFQLEVQALANLDHPNICPILDVGEVGDVKYFTMPLIQGNTLSEFVCRDNVLPVKEIARILKSIAGAVQHAHDVGVVHRDLKPANIIIQPNGQPMIIDFGLAKFLCRESDLQEGCVMGTPAYMSPEQVIGKHKLVGPASDIHALGVIMYHLLTCRLPYNGSIEAIFDQILNDEPEMPTRFRGRLHVGLEQICLKAMAKEISDRHYSADDFAQEIREFVQLRLRAKQRRYLVRKSAEIDLSSTGIRRNSRPDFRISNDNANPTLKFAMFAAVVWIMFVITALLGRNLTSDTQFISYHDHNSSVLADTTHSVETTDEVDQRKKTPNNHSGSERIKQEKIWQQLSGLDNSIQQILASTRQSNPLASSANLSKHQ